MADHLRDQIMAAMGAALTGLATTAGRVYLDEDNPLEDEQLPGITIVQAGESTDPITMPRPRTIEASFGIDVTAYVKRTTAQADARRQVNTVCKEVQIALWNANLALAKKATLVQTDVDLNGDAEKPVAIARMRWEITYYYREDAPDIAV